MDAVNVTVAIGTGGGDVARGVTTQRQFNGDGDALDAQVKIATGFAERQTEGSEAFPPPPSPISRGILHSRDQGLQREEATVQTNPITLGVRVLT